MKLATMLLAGLILSGLTGCSHSTSSSAQPSHEVMDAQDEHPHAKDIDERIATVVPGMSIESVRDRLGSSVSELGAIHWGGSGRRTFVFLVPNRGDLHVNVDVYDIVDSDPELRPHDSWMRRSDGSLDKL